MKVLPSVGFPIAIGTVASKTGNVKPLAGCFVKCKNIS